MKFPLPVDYFECPPLSPEECEQYEQQAVQNAREMLEKAVITNSQYQWKRIADEAEVEIFRGKDPSIPATATLHCATIDLACTLEEVAYFYRNDTTEEFKEMVRRTGHGMVDAANLYWIHRSAEAKVRIQWLLVKTPFDGVVKKRDFCVLESTVLYDADEFGRRTWVRCLKSIEHPCCPEFPNVIRAIQYGTGIICRETNRPGYLQLISLVHCDLLGSLPIVINEMGAKELCRSVRHVDRNIRENRLSESPFLSGEQVISLSSRQRCYLCKRNFGTFLKKRNCFKCGEVVCTQCGPKWSIKVGGTPVNVCACTACSLGSRSSNVEDTSTLVSGFTTPSSVASTNVWQIADDDDSDDDDDATSFVSYSSDDSSMSRYTNSTDGRRTLDPSEGES
ncbi:hypothetical protein LEN26_013594 [Aphanomyces euteiches]|nr:hypothetical protein LEN26_013937 [Aphanomyces euteiches]KAH9110891.1 hypothetical protein LEN26_013594 [Aphanomyces euteiches]KAH9182807.1 hypothetical protein AeNC1_015217 [Aphanomyces euteiches]